MRGVLWVIPSYGRAGAITTPERLARLGVERDSILLCVQDYWDFWAYKRLYEDFAIIACAKAKTVGEARNNALIQAFACACGRDIVMVDDDLIQIRAFLDGKCRRVSERGAFERMMSAIGREMEESGADCGLVGCGEFPPREAVYEGKISGGAFYYFPNRLKTRSREDWFSATLPYGEDTEWRIRRYMAGDKFKFFSGVAWYWQCGVRDFGVIGGCSNTWKNKELRAMVDENLRVLKESANIGRAKGKPFYI